jgi:hypothetical protein
MAIASLVLCIGNLFITTDLDNSPSPIGGDLSHILRGVLLDQATMQKFPTQSPLSVRYAFKSAGYIKKEVNADQYSD